MTSPPSALVRFLGASLALFAQVSYGANTLAVASGDCRDPELLGSMLIFSRALNDRIRPDLMSPEILANRMRPRPERSLEDLQRLNDAGQTQFYSAQYPKAETTLRTVLRVVESMPPNPHAWAIEAAALRTLAMVYREGKRQEEVEGAFRRILRVDPEHVLDPDYYSPTTRAEFERVRKLLAQEERIRLDVFSEPSGADVFIDGRRMGKTPFHRDLVAGSYRVAVVSGPALSFPRVVDLSQPAALTVDLELEASVGVSGDICVSTKDGRMSVDRALKLGVLLQAQQVIVLGRESRIGEPGWVSAALVSAADGKRLREGGVNSSGPGGGDLLKDLAEFVITGRSISSVVPLDGTKPVVLPPPPVQEQASVVAIEAPIASATVAEVRAQPLAWKRPAALGLASVGVLAAVGGTWSSLSHGNARTELQSLLDPTGALPPEGTPEHARAVELTTRTGSLRTRSTLLFVGAGGAIAGSAALWLLDLGPRAGAGEGRVQVLPSVGPESTGMVFSGAW